MNDHSALPGLEGSLPVYERVCEASGAVSAAELERQTELSVDDLRSRLDLLVAYGLLDRRTHGYTVRCQPDEGAERWRQRAADRAEQLHAVVEARVGTEATDVVSDAACLGDDGRRYAAVEADAETELSALLDRIEAAPSTPAGVVVTAAAEDANEIQRLVDDVERSDRIALEMVDAEVVETERGFDYRSYLEAP